MHEIYDGAHSTMLWLGQGDEASVEAFTFLSHWIATPGNTRRLAAKTFTFWKNSNMLASQLAAPETPIIWKAICKIYDCSYWSRAWIVQEVLLSNKILLFHSSHRLADDLVDLFCFFQNVFEVVATIVTEKMTNTSSGNWPRGFMDWVRSKNFQDLPHWYEAFNYHFIQTPASSIIKRRTQRTYLGGLRKGQELEYSIRDHSSSCCHDLHDKVYAFLGVGVKENPGPGRDAWVTAPFTQFPVDYETTLLTLAVQTVTFCQSTSPLRLGQDLLDSLKVNTPEVLVGSQSHEWLAQFCVDIVDAVSKLGQQDKVEVLCDFVGLVAHDERSKEHGLRLIVVGDVEFSLMNGDIILRDDVVFAIPDTNIVVVYRTDDGRLLFVAQAVLSAHRTWRWPTCMKHIETISPPLPLILDEGSSFKEEQPQNGRTYWLSAKTPLTMDQLFIIASQTSSSNKPVGLMQLVGHNGSVSRCMQLLGISDSDPHTSTGVACYSLAENGYQRKRHKPRDRDQVDHDLQNHFESREDDGMERGEWFICRRRDGEWTRDDV